MGFDPVVADKRVSLWKMLLVLTFLSIVDYVLTKSWVAVAGIYGEMNPLLRYAIKFYGIDSVLIIKMVWLTLLGIGIWLMSPRFMTHLKWVMIMLVLFQAYAVAMGVYCHTLL